MSYYCSQLNLVLTSFGKSLTQVDKVLAYISILNVMQWKSMLNKLRCEVLQRRDCRSPPRSLQRESPEASSLSSLMSSSSTPSSRWVGLFCHNQNLIFYFWPGFLEFWLAGSLFRLSFRSQHRPPWGTGIGDEWGTRSVSRFLTFIHFPPFLHQSLLDKAFSKGHLLPTMLSLFYTFTPLYFYTFALSGRDHEHLPSSNAASRPCFPKCKLQKVCKPLPQARTLSRCLSGEQVQGVFFKWDPPISVPKIKPRISQSQLLFQ